MSKNRMDSSVLETAPKEKKPMSAAQEAKVQRERAAADRIFKETGVKVPPTVGAKLLKLEREGGNVSGFLTTIRTTGTGLIRKKPEEKEKEIETEKPKLVKQPVTAPTKNKPMEATGNVVEAVINATNSLSSDEHKILSKCEQIYEKILAKTRKNLKNATGRNASNEDVQRLFNLRKSGQDMPILNYLKLANNIRKSKTVRRTKKNISNVAPAVSKKEKMALETFLEENN